MVDKILSIARGELGTVEYPPNSNKVKYNTEYYGREVSGFEYSWCAVFVWWVFRKAGLSGLYYGGGKTAYCPTLLSYHRAQAVTDYQPGDVIFFNFSGGTSAKHVGICESWDGKNITTIDGNTGTGNEANGGAVMRRTRDKKYIVGAYRPAYEEEIELTEEQVRKIVRDEYSKIEAERAALPADGWAKPYIAEAIDGGVMTDVGGTIERPKAHVTRQELATTAAAILKTVK